MSGLDGEDSSGVEKPVEDASTINDVVDETEMLERIEECEFDLDLVVVVVVVVMFRFILMHYYNTMV